MCSCLLIILASASVRGEDATLKAFEVMDIRSVVERTPTRMQFRAFGRRFALAVSSNRELLASMPAAQRNRIASNDLFLQGSLEGVPGSWVRLNRIAGKYSGGFFDGEELYLIDQTGGFAGTGRRGARADQTIIFRFKDLESSILTDHGGIPVTEGAARNSKASDYATFTSHLREVTALQGSAMMALPMTVVSDVQFTNRHGSNAASVVAGRINFIDGIYSSQLGVGITLVHHEILVDNDVLTSTDASTLLAGERDDNFQLISGGQPGFQQFMESGNGSDIPFQGLAHLFTGRDLDGNTVGIAFMGLGVLCNSSFGYGVDQDLVNSETTSALVFAHEVGHNFNAPHDGEADTACANETFDGIMNAIIDGSQQQFSDCSIQEMSVALGEASCLVEAADPDEVFSNGFENPAL